MMAILYVLLALLGVAGWVLWSGRVVVPANHVGIVTRRYGPTHPDPAFKQVNPANARGVLARTLLPGGFRWFPPVVYAVEFVPRVHVPTDMIGLVTAKEGRTRTDGRVLGRHVDCDSFQDGQAFLEGGGEQGVQVATLAGGQAYYINTRLFDVRTVPRTHVPAGTIGLVQARAGAVRPPDQRFGRHVECDSFQDGRAFLEGGGEQGRQLAVLGGGASYAINPELFEVITVDNVADARDGLTEAHLREISIEEGYTGVVVTLDGAEPRQDADGAVGPRVEGHHSFRLPWEFLANGGWRGVQEETLGEGTAYALNPWFVRVLPIPTRMLSLEWADKAKSEADSYDASLGKIVVNVQGFDLEVALSQNLQIPREVAPRLVSEFGGVPTSGLGGLVNDPAPVQRFVRNVLGKAVSGYFSEIATTSSVLDFLGRYEDVRKDLTDKVTHALEKLGVRTLNTSLGRFTPTDLSLPEALKKRFDAENDLDNLKVGVEQARLKDQIDELQAQSVHRRIALDLEKEVKLLGPENVAMIRIVREFAKFEVPDYIGGGDISAYVQALPMTAVQDLLARLQELRNGQRAISGPERKELTKETAQAIEGDGEVTESQDSTEV